MAQGERQHHILNPATGRPTQGPRGVSLLAKDTASVNGLGTAIMVLGTEGARKLLQGRTGVQALVVERDHSIWQTPGMAAVLQTA
jgi:thiamine biosynthesis lipoprotein